MTIKRLKSEFQEITLLRMFEIPVIDKRTDELEHIIFDIEIVKSSLVAQHEALTTKQAKSIKIAFESLALDSTFSLDEHLQTLHDQCTYAILESDFYMLAE